MNTQLDVLGHRIEMLEIRERTSSNLIDVMKTSTEVHEDEIAEELRHKITDCPDIDHAE